MQLLTQLPTRILASLVGSVLLVASAAAPAAPPSFTDIGPLATGFPGQLFDVSRDGTWVVGRAQISPATNAPFRWSEATGLIHVGDLPGGANSGAASGVSWSGQVVVGSSSSGINSNTEAFRWSQAEGIFGLGDLSFNNSDAFDVTDDGTVIVGRFTGGVGFYWTHQDGTVQLPGGLEVLAVAGGGSAPPPPPRTPQRFAVVVGRKSSNPNSGEVATWNEVDGIQTLGFQGTPARASRDGSVIVGTLTSVGRAFRWTASGGVQDLGNLGSGSSAAKGVSGDGGIVVGWSLGPNGQQPFLWDEDSGMRDLQDVLENDLGLDLSDWDLAEALGISDDGTVVAGVGDGPLGDDRIWVARLGDPEPVVPAVPPLLQLLVVVGLVVSGWPLLRRAR